MISSRSSFVGSGTNSSKSNLPGCSSAGSSCYTSPPFIATKNLREIRSADYKHELVSAGLIPPSNVVHFEEKLRYHLLRTPRNVLHRAVLKHALDFIEEDDAGTTNISQSNSFSTYAHRSAWANNSRIRRSLSPISLFTRSLIWGHKKFRWPNREQAREIAVFPVPGGPYSRIPVGNARANGLYFFTSSNSIEATSQCKHGSTMV